MILREKKNNRLEIKRLLGVNIQVEGWILVKHKTTPTHLQTVTGKEICNENV